MQTLTLGPSVEPPYGASKRVRGVPKWRRRRHANAATGAFGGAPHGATILVRAKSVRWRHANPATGAFGGAPYGATKRVRGVPKWGAYRMRVPPLGP